MTTAQPSLLSLAKQGDANAIATLIGQFLPTDITAKVSLKDDCLKVMLESVTVPDQHDLVKIVHQVAADLNTELIRQVHVYGRELGEDFPHWHEAFELPQLNKPSHSTVAMVEANLTEPLSLVEPTPPSNPQAESFWGSLWGTVAGAAETVGGTAVNAGGALVGTVAGVTEVVGGVTASAGGAVVGTVSGAAGAVGGAAVSAGASVVGTVAGAAGAVGNAAMQTGEAIAGTAVGVASAVGNTAMRTTDGVGYILDMVTNSPQLQDLTKALKVGWLLAIVERVDIDQAEDRVKQLQKKYPHEKASDIAHRIMMEKALFAISSGFATSLLPGFAAAMFAVDVVATMALQAEMVYQIAGTYGLNLREQSRKGEVLAVFGIALGGNSALKAGLGFARNIPGAGAVIGASSNAAMLYALGYAACRFYEAKLNTSSSPTDLHTSQVASDAYLQSLFQQQVFMDQILVHLVLAGNPGKTLQQLLPELQALNLNSASLNAIPSAPNQLPPLENLLNQLSQDFAASLIAQCQRIAQSDGMITPQEAKIIDRITKKFSSVLMFSQ